MSDITTIRHPEYNALASELEKWRLTYRGGQAFLTKYLHFFSTRENAADYKDRKEISYSPSFAKSSLNEIKNSIFQRMQDITRKGGTPSYMNAIEGRDKGVDRENSTMNNFIGCTVLPELISMGKVGVFIDMPRDIGESQFEQVGKNPYTYIYRREDILSWTMRQDTEPDEFAALLLRKFVNVIDPDTLLPEDVVVQYRYFRLIQDETGKTKVQVITYNDEGDQTGRVELNIPRIPFVVFELSQSLLVDVADIQVSLLNLASADMNYSFKSNFPFYTEQYDPRIVSGHLRQNNAGGTVNTIGETTSSSDLPGTATAAATSKNQEIVTGATRGRKYPKGTERPAYIHPSSEPLEISMRKQEQLKRDIKELINLAVENLIPRNTPGEALAVTDQSLEAGLSYIGQELEHGEVKVASFWAMYENSRRQATIKYPTNYSLKDDDQRLKESEKLSDLRGDVASTTYKKEISKQIATTLLSDKVELETLERVYTEIDSSEIPVQDSNTIHQDIEDGLLSVETASKAKGYPDGEVEKAKEEHAERAARIVIAQTKASELKNATQDAGARGVADLDPERDSADDEKNATQKNKDGDVDIKDKTRGKQK